jgi:oligoendopeptidase F
LPFYSIEYALAWLGALQVWQNAQEDRMEAVRGYKQALSLGYTRPLPDLYATAGARFAFDEASVGKAMAFLEERLEGLEGF